ncbi:serine/threonine-protein kinase GRIK1-like isoform X2 [Tasmannia lanceolata]|uniref:serine/threonine-protein kinase GRIK1-like isoform X2 n=1 Tax=Tasmannia lanceolata TaxID=3420 RepID=UPI0040633D2E
MSNSILSEFDGETGCGCCSCLGFLRQKSEKTVDYVRQLSDQFSQECMLNDSLEETTRSEGAGSFSHLKDYKKLPSFWEKNRLICREVPVKEKTRVRQSQDANGKKMINEYVRECKIGCGSYGKVVLYRSITDGKQYAVKAFYKSRLSKVRVAPSETAMTDVLREVSIMKALEHPNIVNLVEVIDDPESDHLYMVLEYVEGKCICDASGTPGGIGERNAQRYLRDIIAGVMHLHAHNVVHGDIKPENLLVTRSGRVKIADFSVSHCFEDDNDELWRSPGTPAFTAPECCLGLTYHGKAADIWAVGATLYCMVLGYWPFIGDSLQDTYDKIVNCPLSLPEDLDPELKDLLQGLLCKDPMQRSTIRTVAEHPWVVTEDGPIPQSSCKCKLSNSQEGKFHQTPP